MITTVIPNRIPTDLGGRLRHYRENAGLTRERVAVHVGRSAGAVRDWELGQRPPRYVFLVQLARLYGVPISDLIGSEMVTGGCPFTGPVELGRHQ